MQNVIITGADGFVGSYTVKKFIDEGINVLAIDRNEFPFRLTPGDSLFYLFILHGLVRQEKIEQITTFR